MIKTITILGLALISTISFAQTEVTLAVNHFLNQNEFSTSITANNNINESFKVTRLEYYISDITLKHDGGKETKAEDIYLLVDAKNDEIFNLGNYDVTNIEEITFNVGVSPKVNNADPTKWESGHPLAPKSPSMHWGWASGYRFIAFEGKAGSSLSTTFEIHALGNQHYFRQTIPVSTTAANNKAEIAINADYAKGLKDMQLSNGVVTHGDYGEAITLLRLFQTSVFTNANGEGSTLSTLKKTKTNAMNISKIGNNSYQLKLNDASLVGSTFSIIDAQGKSVQKGKLKTLNTNINIQYKGFLMLYVRQNDLAVEVRRILNF